MGLIDDSILKERDVFILRNSLKISSRFPSFRIDTFFFENMRNGEEFFDKDLTWTKLGYLIDQISNGENLGTEWYSIDETTNTFYLSVSQITEFGVEEKNVHYLNDDILDHKFGKNERQVQLLKLNHIILTRSGTPGIALCSNHPSFDYENINYVPSGFLITFNLRKELGIKSEVISFYLNLSPVRHYLIANSSGRCQRNISQEIVKDLPIPEELFETQDKVIDMYKEIEDSSLKYIKEIKKIENQLENLWDIPSEKLDRYLIS